MKWDGRTPKPDHRGQTCERASRSTTLVYLFSLCDLLTSAVSAFLQPLASATIARVEAPKRIVTLLPAATEIVCAVGGRFRLVGRSHACDHPADVIELPAVTRPRQQPPQGQPADPLSALAAFEIDFDLLAELQPDLIVTQDLCAHCAVSLADVEQAVRDRLSDQTRILCLQPTTLHEVIADVRRVAQAIGMGNKGTRLATDMMERINTVAAEVRQGRAAPNRPTVAAIEWFEPLMVAGNWVPDLVELAGGVNLLGEAGQHSPTTSLDALLAAEPQVLLLMPCGLDVETTRARFEAQLEADARWQEVRAVREGQVYACDGNAFFNRPGPRVVESLEIAAECLHPQVFSFGHDMTGWQRL